MLTSRFIRFHDTKLKRPYARVRLVVLFCLQILLAVAYKEYLIWRQVYQTHFDLEEWLANQVSACNGDFVARGNQYLWLKNVKLNLRGMVFILPCNTEIPRYWFNRRGNGTPYTKWLTDLEVKERDKHKDDIGDELKIRGFTFTLRRVEAHNLYHTMCEIYNIFLVHKLLGIEWKDINILFMDSRPASKMDEIWTGLFSKVIHHEDVHYSQIFENLIWTPIGYQSPLHRHYLDSLPFATEFKDVFINSFGVSGTKIMNCTSINYTLILRHDYISHPERATLFQGKVQRKLANEKEVIRAIQNNLGQKDYLRIALLETLSIREQVEIFANTDVLIAVHGAGMTHILNLPHHAFVLELRPYKLDRVPGYHFRAMSRWRGLNYVYVKSDNINDDIGSYEINIPLEELSQQIRDIKCHLDSYCGTLDTLCSVLQDP